MTYWFFDYDGKSDSWEAKTNQAFATKELAMEYVNENEKNELIVRALRNWKSEIEKIKKVMDLSHDSYSSDCLDGSNESLVTTTLRKIDFILSRGDK